MAESTSQSPASKDDQHLLNNTSTGLTIYIKTNSKVLCSSKTTSKLDTLYIVSIMWVACLGYFTEVQSESMCGTIHHAARLISGYFPNNGQVGTCSCQKTNTKLQVSILSLNPMESGNCELLLCNQLSLAVNQQPHQLTKQPSETFPLMQFNWPNLSWQRRYHSETTTVLGN